VIENAIGANGETTILNGCYSQLVDARCALITRDRTGAVNGNPGEISNIDSRNQNFRGGLETDGIDFGGGYRFMLGDYGSLTTRLDNTYVIYYGDIDKPKRGEVNGDGDISGGNLIGGVTSGSSGGATRHRLRSNLSATWKFNDFTVAATLEYRSGVNESCTVVRNTALALANNAIARQQPQSVVDGFLALQNLCSDPTRLVDQYSFRPGTNIVVATPTVSPRNRFGGVTYTHLQGSWDAPWNGTISGGIRNLFDKNPPFSSNAFANSYDAQYLTPGRFFFVSYKQKF
jgi:iron complex outermembrane recepter protein